jgi:uridine kinase
MKVLLLVSGSLRSFRENLRQYPPEYDIAVYAAREEEDTYLNPQTVRFLLDEPRIKTLLVEGPSPDTWTNTQRQWHKLHRLWQAVPRTYDRYVRIRPDIFLEDPEALRAAVTASEFLTIPDGNDRDGINDQLAIGTEAGMNAYVFLPPETRDTSERLLAESLHLSPICRGSIPYRLILSRAKVVAIAGDSGSGKSTLSSLIRPLFLFDKVLEYETDRYHKWERGDSHWQTTSHLHPDANHLEKLEDDTFNLKVGNAVFAVDYDHATGTFTPPTRVEPKENILLCGLHTLYTQQLRDLSDLKIYLDTSDDLKTAWKVQRDTTVRQQTAEDVRSKIESRRKDFDAHVEPQRQHADLIISRDPTHLRIQAPGHRDWVPGSGFWDDPSVDLRPEIQDFLASLSLPPIDATPGFDGVIQFTVLRALYTKHG